MADVKSNAQAVQQAERDMYGPVGEAQALLELYRSMPGDHAADASWSLLAHGALERFVQAFEHYQGLISLHGRPATSVPALKPATEA